MTAAITIGLFACGVSLLTLFSGFGLGTLLMPAFALFLPVEVAVASTAIVHAANNVFKVGLLAGGAERGVVLRFGLPAIVASFAGALALTTLSSQEPLATWSFLGRSAHVTPAKLIMGLLILGFALFELVPALRSLRAPLRWLPVGGLLSGFFGGLSGHQGALRAVFLTPLGLSPRFPGRWSPWRRSRPSQAPSWESACSPRSATPGSTGWWGFCCWSWVSAWPRASSSLLLPQPQPLRLSS